jgi:hypothetical protein
MMADQWWRHLKGRPFYWALDGTHAGADLFMLQHVVERPKRSRSLAAARLALEESAQVEGLKRLLEQKNSTFWTPRYRTPLWILRMLAELGLSGNDERIAEALDCLLEQEEGQEAEGAPVNLNAIVLHIALAFGFSDDERVQMRLIELQKEIEQERLPSEAVALADWLTQAAFALAQQAAHERDSITLKRLRDHLCQLTASTLTRYERYTFPTFDQPDDLLLAQAALQLNIAGEWLRPWIERIENAQDERGLWWLNRALPTPSNIAWEQENAPSRWISAKALYVLRAFYGE